MERFANPEIFQTMSIGEKVMNSLRVIGLGMGIVFLVLILLMFSMILMSRIVNGAKKKPAPKAPEEALTKEEPLALTPAVEQDSDEEALEELMVVLLAASLLMEKEGPNLRITDVRVQGAPVSAWGQAALAQNTRRL